MSADEFTTEQVLEGISHALADNNMEAVVSLMHLLALKDPGAARAVMDAVEIARLVQR